VTEEVAGWWGGPHADPLVRQAMMLGASQDPGELGMAMELVGALDPLAVVVEIGCDRGGTLFAWRTVCERVYGITLPDNGWDTGGSGLPLEAHGAVVRFGDSHDPASLDWLRGELNSEPVAGRLDGHLVDALVIDGDHSAAGLVADLVMYGPLVRVGGLVLIHDINSTHDPRVQVPEVWHRLRAEYDAAQIEAEDDGGPGWGVITVREADRFALEEAV
jgi:Methyltransferase domain